MTKCQSYALTVAFLTTCCVHPVVPAASLRLVAGHETAELMSRAKQSIATLRDGDSQLAATLGHRLAVTHIPGPDGYLPIQRELDPHCLLEVSINPESRVKVASGPAVRALQKGEWKYLLVKVVNEAGVTAPLRVATEQAYSSQGRRDNWLEIETFSSDEKSELLSGKKVDYRIVRLRAQATGKRSAIISADVGQGTADIGFRNDTLMTFTCFAGPPVDMSNARPSQGDDDLRFWLRNMLVDHAYSVAEAREATGLSEDTVKAEAERLRIQETPPESRAKQTHLRLLPYPGGRHPRIGFREAAIHPQRETKASVFTPWDPNSYVVLDVPEAVFSNLGLLYLAHVDVPTLWESENISLEPLEWDRSREGELTCERTLPNGVRFGVKLVAGQEAVRVDMWLHNGTRKTLTDLRVQICALLAGAKGFEAQTNDNKIFWGAYSAVSDNSGRRWVVMAFDPIQRAWGNPDCPCLHADPQFPDCPPGETVHARGRLSFYEGADIHGELLRIERTGWRESSTIKVGELVTGAIIDADTGEPLAARIHIRDQSGRNYVVESSGGRAVPYRRELPHLPDSPEVHTCLSADPFQVYLAPGEYTFRVERGKDYLPEVRRVQVSDAGARHEFALRRWVDMAELGWYSGDTHVHRTVEELTTVMPAENLNVAFPLTQWVSDSRARPSELDAPGWDGGLIHIDDSHVLQPRNTEYEIVTVGKQRHVLGSCLILNQQAPLDISAPPVAEIANEAHRQGALIDMDKHSWPWSLVLAPVMGVDLFELSNNHLWQTDFGFHDFTLDTIGDYMGLERNDQGLTEWGWMNYGFETYYALLNCGLDIRVSAGTASGVHPVPLGFGRVYINLPNSFDYAEWVNGLSKGRSFVSTGPMLLVEFDGEGPGTQFEARDGQSKILAVTGEALSRCPLERIEVVHNGTVVKVIEPPNQARRAGGYASKFNASVNCDVSGWVAARCFARTEEGRIRFAHTNPVHVRVPGQPLLPTQEQIEYLVDRVQHEVRSNAHVLDQASLAEFREALRFYQSLAERVRERSQDKDRVAHVP